jgi:hypothetical protein
MCSDTFVVLDKAGREVFSNGFSAWHKISVAYEIEIFLSCTVEAGVTETRRSHNSIV